MSLANDIALLGQQQQQRDKKINNSPMAKAQRQKRAIRKIIRRQSIDLKISYADCGWVGRAWKLSHRNEFDWKILNWMRNFDFVYNSALLNFWNKTFFNMKNLQQVR